MGDHKHKKESKKSSRKEHKESSKRHHKHKKGSKEKELEIDYSDPSLWVEASDQIEMTPAEYLKSQQEGMAAKNQEGFDDLGALPKEESSRHGWMLDSGFDFGSMGLSKPKEEPKPNPDEPKISSRELNQYLVKGTKIDDIPQQKSSIKFGDAGSSWRMMKLKRTKEQAEDEGRSLWEVGIEKYGSEGKFQEALDEREYLDGRKRHKTDRDRYESRGREDRPKRNEDRKGEERSERRYMFTHQDSHSQTFKRPEAARPSSTKALLAQNAPAQALPSFPVHTGIPPSSSSALTRDQLNKLNAKLVKARLMGSDQVEALESQYQQELENFENSQNAPNQTEVLPAFDNQGRLYDYALNQKSQKKEELKGKRKYEGTHDRMTGERIKYGTADESLSLAEMVRQERGGGRGFDMDMEFANRIVSDTTFENSNDYMDEKADIIASKKGQTEEQKMRRAVTDYKRTQEALKSCRFCYHDDHPPQLALVSLATTCYLAMSNVQELTPGSCMIVPLQHVTSMLECDDDVWTEIRNFQKCLMKMFHEQDKGVIFMETVTNLRSQRHTVIEAIPIPYGVYEDIPAYFKESILSAEEEWSQHKKLIDTSDRGFRHSMVKTLPYFHVWFGLDKGYGHVIENPKEFPYWFGKETIAGSMDLGPELWRRPKYYSQNENQYRLKEFRNTWDKWDWTAAL
ncbi:CwfJ C-terminus 1-domain-containing protein-like protein [Sporodiniella umbellata]|nr:CwfJ C-terminus 1-domain-containing protein-like protein [Sporodiniella umbellata]